MSEALRALLREAPGAGELTGLAVRTGAATHAVCGDEVEVFVRVRDGAVVDFAWRARGCPACVAVAAAARDALIGVPLPQLAASLARRVQELGGLAPAERHALALVSDAIACAR